MSKHAVSVLAAAILGLATAAFALGQTTTTTVTKTVQNPDGSYTVIEYPAKKEVTVTLSPVGITGAKGVATILRDDDGTKIKLNLTDVPADVTALNLYAVDDSGNITPLGPIAINNGVGTLAAAAPLSKFMLVASPDELTAYDPKTKVLFRSTVPEGFAVVPVSGPRGEKVAAVSTSGSTPATPYSVAMLNIPAYKKGDDTKIKVDFSGAMSGARANIFITPRKDGPTKVNMRFHDLKEVPSGQTFILWAVSPDNNFVKLGQVVNTPGRNEAEIKSETTLPDFGLLVTMEDASLKTWVRPAGPTVGTITIVP